MSSVSSEAEIANPLEQTAGAAGIGIPAQPDPGDRSLLEHLSHKIRTPLDNVVEMIDLLKSTGLNEVQNGYAQSARDSADVLMEIINNILEFSKIEAGKVEIERVEFDLHKLVGDLTELFTPLAGKKNLTLSFLLPPELPHGLIGDPTRIRQVLTKLVSNALKFTSKGSVTVLTSLQSSDESNATLRIEVKDTGIGIAPDRLDRLFKSVSQVDTSTPRKYDGSGLGLAISRRLVELMGGEIGVESVEGDGTTFWFTVPVGVIVVVTPPPPPPAISTNPTQNIHVLIAEPDPTHRLFVAEQLTSHYAPSSMVVDYGNVIESLRNAAITGTPFDVVMLPFAGEIGFALRKEIAADATLNSGQFVALLDTNDQTSAAIAAEEGFAACLHRPFTESKIVDTVTQALRQQQQPQGPSTAPATGVEEPAPSPVAVEMTVVPTAVNEPAPAPAVADAAMAPVEVNEPDPLPATAPATMVDTAVNEPAPAAIAAETTVVPVVVDEPAPSPVAAEPKEAPPVVVEPVPSPVAAEPTVAPAAVVEPAPSPVAVETTVAPIVANEPTPPPVTAPATLFAKNVKESAKASTPAPSRSASPIKPAHPPIDVDNLLSRCMQDPDFARRTLEKFQIRAAEDVEKLRQITQQGDTAQIKRIANNLKAVSAHVAADSLRDIAFEIEQLSMAADREKIVGQLKRLNDEAQRCADFIPSAIQQLAQAAEKAKGK